MIDFGMPVWALAAFRFDRFGPTERAVLAVTLFIITAIGLIVFIIRAKSKQWRAETKRRTEEMQSAMSGMTLTFQGDGRNAIYCALLKRFKLGQRGDTPSVTNFFESPHGDRFTHLMDYWYWTGGGKNRGHIPHTLALNCDKDHELPAFVLVPEGLFARMAQLFGSQDFDFSAYPKFSRTFKLQGEDEAAVRAVFTPAVLAELERHPGLMMEAKGQYMIFSREGGLIKGADLPQFLKDAQTISRLFAR